MRWLLDLSIALTRGWVAAYTRGVPGDVRAERREEIDCDLWEHQRLAELDRQPVTGTAAQVMFRLLLGIPDDLFWRIEAGRLARSEREITVSESLSMKAFLLLGILLAGAAAATGAGNLIFLAGDWEDGAGTVQRLYGLLVMLAAGSVIVGLLLSRPRPTLGVRLVLLGCVGTIVLWFWVFMITIPVSIGLILLARKRAYGEALPWKKQTPRLA